MLPPTKKKKFNQEFIAIPEEKAEKIIISKKVTTEETLLEKVDHLTLPNKFVSKYSNIYVVDMGSSFVKGKQLSIFDGSVESSLIKFVDNSLEFLPTKFFRNIDNGRVSVSIPRTCNGASNTWLPLENIKKIFMIYQLLEISIGSHQVRVATIMKDIVKCVFEEMTHTVTDDCPDFEGLDCLIFTCPTGTSKTSKLIFRNTIYSALKDYIPNSKVELEDVFVFEESNCLHWHTVQRKGVKMLIDIGHLTIDIIVMMNDKIIYKNSEAVGSASLHSIFEKHHLDPYDVMGAIFKDPSRITLPNSVSFLEEQIIEELSKITQHICLIILQYCPENVLITGALSKVKYFQNKLKDLISIDRLKQVKSMLLPYLKKEYEAKPISSFELRFENTGRSALLEGIQKMVTRAVEDGEIRTDLQEKYESQCTYPGILFAENEKDFKINLFEFTYDLYKKQDVELFLFRFSPIIDKEKIPVITCDNLGKIGLLEFIRVCTVELYFEQKIQIQKSIYHVQLELENEFLVFKVYCKRENIFSRTILKIDNSKSVERVPLNEFSFIFGKECEKKAWHGAPYKIKYPVQLGNLDNMNLSSIKNFLSEQVLKEFANSLDLIDNEIPVLDGKTDAELDKTCVVCKKETPQGFRNTSHNTLPNYQECFKDDSIGIGQVCSQCYQEYIKLNKERKLVNKLFE